ncbi:MAG: galactose mutarotase [Treponema sp.]|jgi:aldose 1-epimerase|nr:galactose mutarotase [Treponema sp.]
MKISKKTFGVLSSGEKASLYTLKAGDLSLSLSTLGAALTSLRVPSSKKGKGDVLLGYPVLGSYANNKPFIGATIGRFGNRIGNGTFTLNDAEYRLYPNDGAHTLHGGRRGFDKLLWKAEAYEERDGVFVRFELESPDGDEGFPGNLKAAVSYGLTKSNEIIADYQAKVDAPCPVNLTNHAYFNLAGEGTGDILSHELILFASSYVEADENLIPTGKLLPVQNTPFDFRTRKPVGRDIDRSGGPSGSGVLPGYDHCFVVDGEAGKLRPCAEVFEESSGRIMRVFTTQPGVQFYTGNFLDGIPGKIGSVYDRYGGFCLETQHFPDSPNKPAFPSCVFGPKRPYHEKALFAFEW